MKRTAFRLMITAAAALAAVATASAQNMKAEIPFAFHASGARMEPGTYWVTLNQRGSAPVFRIANVETKRSIMAMSVVTKASANYKPSNPVLTFKCVDTRCVLASVRNEASMVYAVSRGKDEPGTRIATVALKVDRAE
jgi:hypothetical protein